jgi:outer membrane protein OmpU
VKKFLLGTTAFVAVGVCGGGAFADNQPIKMGIGGYWRGAGGDVLGMSPCNQVGATVHPAAGFGPSGTATNAACNQHHQAFQQDSLLDFNGSTKLDNGLTVGVHIQLRGIAAASSGDTEKRSYVQFQGTFGEIRFGDYDDARLQKALSAPSAGSLFGQNSPFFSITANPVGTNTTNKPIDTKRAQRIGYFSPTIAGFSLAMTYAPNSSKGNLNSGTLAIDDNSGQNSQSWSLAGAYDNKFGDFRLQAFAATSQTHQEAERAIGTTSVVSPRAYDGGAQVSWGPIAFGGDYEYMSNVRSATFGSGGGGNLSNSTFDLGVLYTMGPFSTSLDWSRGSYKGFAGAGGGGVCAALCGNTARLNVYDLIFDYVLGPGISIGAALQFDNYTSGIGGAAGNGSAATNDYHDTVIEVGTAITF